MFCSLFFLIIAYFCLDTKVTKHQARILFLTQKLIKNPKHKKLHLLLVRRFYVLKFIFFVSHTIRLRQPFYVFNGFLK